MADVKMTLTEHLAEMRARIIKIILAIIIFTVLSYIFRGEILFILQKPLSGFGDSLHAFTLAEGFYASMKVALYAGFFLSLPVVFYHVFMFCVPAMKPQERNIILAGFVMSWSLFYIGIFFAFLAVLPVVVKALKSFLPPYIIPTLSLMGYIDFVFTILIGFGLAFQLPLVIILLVQLGIISIETLKKYRRYAILIIFILAAIFTPPDVVSQIMMAIPLLLLYELSIIVSIFLRRGKKEKEKEKVSVR